MMNVEIKETKLVAQEVVEDICCDFCNTSCKDVISSLEDGDEVFNLNYASLTASFGYGSTKFDGLKLTLHLCQDCYEGVLDSHGIDVNKLGSFSYWD